MADITDGVFSGTVSSLRARWESGNMSDNFTGGSSRSAARGRNTVSQRQVEEVVHATDPEDTVEEFRAVPGCPDPERHASVLQAVTATTTNQGTLHLMFKSPGSNTVQAQALNLSELFRKEAEMYSNVLPRLAALWPDTPLDIFPRALQATPERIVLEDLNKQGYCSLEELDAEHCAVAMCALGRLHAASLALKAAAPGDATAMFSAAGKEVVYTPQRRAVYDPLFTATAKNTVDILKRNSSTSRYVKEVDIILSSRFDRLQKLLRPTEPTSVLTHGDLRADNILFAYDQETGKPDRVKFIDFQHSRYGPPALDINFLLYCSSTAEARDQVDDLLRAYHRSLSAALKQVRAPAPYSLAELRRDVQQGAVYGLMEADIVLRERVNGTAPGAVPELVAVNAPDDDFAQRIIQVVEELGEIGALKN